MGTATFAERLNEALKIRNISQNELAKRAGIHKSSISYYANGTYEAKQDGLTKLALALDVSEVWLMGLDVPMKRESGVKLKDYVISMSPEPTFHRIPILGKIAAGLPILAEENIIGYTCTERNGGNEYFALQVEGDSMNAERIHDGDIVIIKQTPQVEDGEIAAIMVNDENATIKKYRREGDKISLIPWSNNPVHQTQTYDLKENNIRIIGKIVETRTHNEGIEEYE